MPLFPEQLYQLTQRDHQVTWLEPFFASISNAAIATSVDSGFVTVPNDRVLLLLNVAARVEPGAGQTSSSLNVRFRTQAGAASFQPILRQENYAATGVTFNLHWVGQILVPSAWEIFATGGFSAAPANPNSTFLNVIGMLIPNANIQRV